MELQELQEKLLVGISATVVGIIGIVSGLVLATTIFGIFISPLHVTWLIVELSKWV